MVGIRVFIAELLIFCKFEIIHKKKKKKRKKILKKKLFFFFLVIKNTDPGASLH